MKLTALVLALVTSHAPAQVVVSSTTVIDPLYRNGYRCGVKQPLGHTLGSVSVHNLSRENGGTGVGSPDYLVWVDESAGTAEVLELGHDDAAVTNPGGMAQFNSDGSLWYALGARADDLPFDLMHGGAVVLDDFVTYGASTTPCFHPLGETGLFAYRYAGSSLYAQVSTRVIRFDLATPTPTRLSEEIIAVGSLDPTWGKIGIEQLWTRHDPRHGTALTWQWWRIDPRYFGSNPFLMTRDGGETWTDAAGAIRTLPMAYADRDATLVPIDHLANDLDAQWHPRDIGFTPRGAPWLCLPDGLGGVAFCLWTGEAWDVQVLANGLLDKSRPFACGTTKNFMVFAYAAGGDLYVRLSGDGAAWTPPELVDSTGTDKIGLVSYFQPAEYADDRARFLVGHFQGGRAHAQNYEQALRMVTVGVHTGRPVPLP